MYNLDLITEKTKTKNKTKDKIENRTNTESTLSQYVPTVRKQRNKHAENIAVNRSVADETHPDPQSFSILVFIKNQQPRNSNYICWEKVISQCLRFLRVWIT